MDKDALRDYPKSKLSVYPVSQTNPSAFFHVYINTFISASLAELVTFPLDVTKTRLQMQGEKAEKAALEKVKRGMIGTLLEMARKEGRRGMYGGFSAMLIRNCVFNAPRIVIYDYLRKQLIQVDEHGKERLLLMHAFLAGCLAGGMAQSVANPLDIVKVRMQMEGKRRGLGYPVRVRNVKQALDDVYRQGGVKSLWKGVGPSRLRSVLMTAGDTACYDLSKRYFIDWLAIDDGALIQFLASISAGLAATILSTPADVVKSRIMNQPLNDEGHGLHYRNSFDCFYKLVTQEGLAAMYKGFVPCGLRIGPWSIIFWIAFEQLHRLQGVDSF